MNTNDNMEMRIREVAQQLFFKQGYAATSTIQIAKEVGCTQALVHYYYRTKENLSARFSWSRFRPRFG